MLYYLADIMSDATDFSWQNAKAAHAVLLCDMERGLSVGKKHPKLIGLGEPTPKNILKILNLGPEILIQMVAKSHGFAKPFKQVCVLSIGIMKVMANGKDTFVLHV